MMCVRELILEGTGWASNAVMVWTEAGRVVSKFVIATIPVKRFPLQITSDLSVYAAAQA